MPDSIDKKVRDSAEYFEHKTVKYYQELFPEVVSGHVSGGFNSRIQGDMFSEALYMATGSIYSDRAYGWDMADNMIRDGLIYSFESKNKPAFKCFPDGKSWCCIGLGFINLQESDTYTFGDSYKAAVDSFLRGGDVR